MIYVISDLHGSYEKYRKMLDLIQFSDLDLLYVLGDCADRGPDGIKIYQDMMKRPNVIPIIGNHELFLLDMYSDFETESEVKEKLDLWAYNGGGPTLRSFMQLEEREKVELLNYVEGFLGPQLITVNDRKYLLTHTAPEPMRAEDWEDWDEEEYTWGKNIDYDEQYFDDITLVTGHCITGLIDPAYLGKIYRNKNHIAIDCGAAFDDGKLGCLRLDDQKEFYL